VHCRPLVRRLTATPATGRRLLPPHADVTSSCCRAARAGMQAYANAAAKASAAGQSAKDISASATQVRDSSEVSRLPAEHVHECRLWCKNHICGPHRAVCLQHLLSSEPTLSACTFHRDEVAIRGCACI